MLRYRGYYSDSTTGRFINADGYISTGTGILGYNMHAYCNNNPVMYVDSEGNSPGLILGLVVLGANVIQDFDNDRQLSGVQYTVGVGIGVDWHHRQTYTFTIIPVVDRRR